MVAETDGEKDPGSTSMLYPTDELEAVNREIIEMQVSDHTVAKRVVNGVPIYTWNMLGFRTPHGFGPTRKETEAEFLRRFHYQLTVIAKFASEDCRAVFCLQEFTNHFDNKYHQLLTEALKGLHPYYQFAYNVFRGVGSGKFGLVTIYNLDEYILRQDGIASGGAFSGDASSEFKSEVFPQQNNRVLKVVLEGRRQDMLCVVNVHLEWSKVNSTLLDELRSYATRYNDKTIPFVITGDFNYSLYKYSCPDAKVSVVNETYFWDHANNRQKRNITDGFISEPA
eukprot:Platyproteum_vivax@DN6345_c0_g1_i1.p1